MWCTGRPWPLVFGAGVGIGMGLSNCQHDFKYPDLYHGQLRKVKCRKKQCSLRMMLSCYIPKLFKAYCTSLYGCELWSLLSHDL